MVEPLRACGSKKFRDGCYTWMLISNYTTKSKRSKNISEILMCFQCMHIFFLLMQKKDLNMLKNMSHMIDTMCIKD